MNFDGYKLRNVHFSWTPENMPIGKIEPDSEISLKIPDASTNQIKYGMRTEDLANIDTSQLDGALGPIEVVGAKKGSVIEVHILEIKTGSWGWSAIIDDLGILKGRFKQRLVFWDIVDGVCHPVNFLEGIQIPLEPMLGVIGVSPSRGEFGMIPPQIFGGNMDSRINHSGTRVYLPVLRTGGMLSFADPHASQGDGEVCGTGIETSAEVLCRIDIVDNMKIKSPSMIGQRKERGQCFVATGIGANLYEASKEATLSVIDFIVSKGFSEEEAYILASVSMDLVISEIVDEPNFVVSAYMPLKVFH
ncbi:MAG: acetamidase/formamidase family protein [Thermoplasmataceae archaeon]